LISGNKIILNTNFVILDVRPKDEYTHFHLPESIHVEYQKCLVDTNRTIKNLELKNKKVLVVCNLGLRSNAVTNILRKDGVEAYSLKGGITEWSHLDLPRWKPGVCLKNKC
jgi:rhodanese-related sulfurtransferase